MEGAPDSCPPEALARWDLFRGGAPIQPGEDARLSISKLGASVARGAHDGSESYATTGTTRGVVMTDQKTTPTMSKNKNKTTMTGAGILWECLEREGVKDVFGYPGGAILPAYDALKHSKIHHILVRHEQGATHMADGYARASGKVGVAVATSGPGATNMGTGIATAMLDSSPVLCITGQVSSRFLRSHAFQEIDITGTTLP